MTGFLDATARVFFGEVPLAVADSLRDRSEEWSASSHLCDGKPFKLHHVSGSTLWLANGACGMGVMGPHGELWGGVTFLSTFHLSPGHHLLRAAAREWLRQHWTAPRYSLAVVFR